MLQLALRTLRFRTGAFVAAFLAMVGAAAILMACGGLIETGVRTAVPPQRLAAADIVVAGDQEYDALGGDPDEPAIMAERVRVDAGLAEEIAALPGVRETTTHVFDGVAPDGTTDAVGVVVEEGVDVDEVRERIDAELTGPVVTLVGDQRGQAEIREAKGDSVNLVALAGVFTAFAILIAIFGVASVLALSVQQRRQELALLRAIGATPRQVRRLVVRETAVLAVLATAVGVGPGRLLGGFIFDRLAARGIVSDAIAFHLGWIPTVAAMAIAVVAAVAGAVGAGRRAARIRPTQALAEVGVEARTIGLWRTLLAVLLVGGGTVLTVVSIVVLSDPLTPATAAPAVILLAVGTALLAPVLGRVTTALLQWPVRSLGGITGQLAVLNARGRSGRTAAVMAPVILLTGVATGMLYLQATNDHADRESFAASLVADAVVTSREPVDAALVAQVAGLPGVTGASAYVSSTGFVEEPEDRSPAGEGWTLQGVSAEGAAATTPVEVADGSLEDLAGDTVSLGADHADRLGVGVGDPITLRMGDNTTVEVRVVALVDGPDDYDTLLLPADTLAAHTTDGGVHRILVTGGAGLTAELDRALGPGEGIEVSDREVLFREYDEARTTATFAIYLMVLMIAAYVAVTVVNTLVSSTTARRRELGLQRLAGSTRGQVIRMVGTESALVAVGGVALGTLAALAVLVPVSLKRLDSPVPVGSPLIYAATAGLSVLLTVAATLLPAWRATRGRPAESALAVE